MNKFFRLVSICGLAAVLTACQGDNGASSTSGSKPQPKEPKPQGIPVEGYQLVWADEFDGTELDASKWDHRYLGPRRDAINVKDTVSLNDEGHLVMTTKKVGDQYHTAMIGTEKKYLAKYGYFEARVRLQQQIGHWSAFWLQTPGMGTHIGNPAKAGTEIDIYEYLRKEGDTVRHALHWDGYKEEHKSLGERPEVEGLSEGWHTFGVHWTEDEYVFYVDRKPTWTTSKAVSQRSQYIILSLEVGKWAGDIGEATLPDDFLIDYVRVYQKQK